MTFLKAMLTTFKKEGQSALEFKQEVDALSLKDKQDMARYFGEVAVQVTPESAHACAVCGEATCNGIYRRPVWRCVACDAMHVEKAKVQP